MKSILNIINHNVKEIIIIIFLFALVTAVSFNFSLLHIKGSSMSPTYEDGDIVIIKHSKEIKDGDIVIFNSPESWTEDRLKFIKRIAASEGDVINITNQSVELNGKIITHLEKCETKNSLSKKISKDELFVLGDNFGKSNDSYFQFCHDNLDFTISKDLVVTHGREFFSIGGLFK